MHPTSLEDMAEQVNTRDDFVRFAWALHDDFKRQPAEWDNNNLGVFLEALAAWSNSMGGYFRNIGQPVPEQPSWRLLAEMLLAARVYE